MKKRDKRGISSEVDQNTKTAVTYGKQMEVLSGGLKMIKYKVSKKYAKAAKILTKWKFIYEELPSGNLRAEPMDFQITDKIQAELSKAGYFSLRGKGFLIIKELTEVIA